MFKQQLEFAAGALASGNLAAIEIVCRDILDVDPKNVSALNLLGVVAANIGAIDHAKSYIKAALRIEPGNQRVRANLDLLKTGAKSLHPSEAMTAATG
ncbi:MAG TPA: hypothetical protein VKY22_28800 [Bradyrhizobium sp.]|nr:hypothetical protein [Bradyrhizobium sp.]